MNDVKNKVVIVTGGTAGIGEESVRQLAANGAKVVFNGRRAEPGEKLETELTAQGFECLFIQGDAGIYEDNERLIKAAIDKYGRIDCLVCNAGRAWKQTFHEISNEDWNNMLATNLSSAFYIIKLALPHMMEQKSGSVIFMSSGMINCPLTEMGHYISTKAMIESLARCLSLDYCRYGIRFNILCPGPTKTAVYDHVPEAAMKEILMTAPTHEMCEPSDVIKSLLFLVSDDSKIVYAAKITPDLADGCGVRFD